jgi:hypothetical protein
MTACSTIILQTLATLEAAFALTPGIEEEFGVDERIAHFQYCMKGHMQCASQVTPRAQVSFRNGNFFCGSFVKLRQDSYKHSSVSQHIHW